MQQRKNSVTIFSSASATFSSMLHREDSNEFNGKYLAFSSSSSLVWIEENISRKFSVFPLWMSVCVERWWCEWNFPSFDLLRGSLSLDFPFNSFIRDATSTSSTCINFISSFELVNDGLMIKQLFRLSSAGKPFVRFSYWGSWTNDCPFITSIASILKNWNHKSATERSVEVQKRAYDSINQELLILIRKNNPTKRKKERNELSPSSPVWRCQTYKSSICAPKAPTAIFWGYNENPPSSSAGEHFEFNF